MESPQLGTSTAASDQDVDHEDIPLIKQDEFSEKARYRKQNGNATTILICSMGLFAASVILFASSVVLFVHSSNHHITPQAAIKMTQIYSPILDEVEMDVTDTLFNGSLWPGNHPNPWRGSPDAVTNDAWADFEKSAPIVISSEQIRKIGKDPSIAAKYEDDFWGFGPDAYIGELDFVHQIHCLNILRVEAFRGWNGTIEYQERPALHWIHLRHCTDMLMQHMLCNADTGIITFNWVEDARHPFPDMSVNRKCRDWTQIMDYQAKHTVDADKYFKYLKPDNAREVKQPPEYWAWLANKQMKEATG